MRSGADPPPRQLPPDTERDNAPRPPFPGLFPPDFAAFRHRSRPPPCPARAANISPNNARSRHPCSLFAPKTLPLNDSRPRQPVDASRHHSGRPSPAPQRTGAATNRRLFGPRHRPDTPQLRRPTRVPGADTPATRSNGRFQQKWGAHLGTAEHAATSSIPEG